MYQTLLAYFSRLRFPEYSDFIAMGLGIDSRYKRSKRFWNQHIRLSKEFQARSIKRLHKLKSVAVLGAGSLIDIDVDALQRNFIDIQLFDANPLAMKSWQQFERNLSTRQSYTGHHLDLTFSLKYWTEYLEDFLESYRTPDFMALQDFLNELSCNEVGERLGSFDAVLSINLLSQIPIYWRDRVHSRVKELWEIDTDDEGRYSISLQNALERSMYKLQQNHLQLLKSINAKLIVLITDSSFMYYEKDYSKWQVEQALFLQPEHEFETYELIEKDSWFWHIAPQGVEEGNFGAIHDVHARAYVPHPLSLRGAGPE